LTLVASNPAIYPTTRKIDWDPLLVFDEAIQADTTSAEAVVSALSAASGRWDGCLTFSDYHAEVAAQVARGLSLPGPDPAVVRMMKQKHLLRAQLASTPFHVPHALISDPRQLAEAAEAIAFPMIAKPTAAGGAVGVRLVENMTDLNDAYQAISLMRQTSRGTNLPGQVLLEHYLEGPLYSVETLSWDGHMHIYGITDREFYPRFPFTESGSSFPVLEGTQDGVALKLFVQKLFESIGFTDSAAHTELKLTASGPMLVESNPRLAGGHVPTLIQIATGSDPYLEAMLVALAIAPSPRRPRDDSAAALATISADATALKFSAWCPILGDSISAW
jgi:biotin carboxylase